MKRKLIAIIAATAFAIVFGTGLAYALFTSNTLNITNNSISAGEAAIKFCDQVDANAWTTSMNPATSLSGMVPGEEREVYGGRHIYIGNDGGQLANTLGSGICTSYMTAKSNSTVNLKIVPNLEFTSTTCPTSMADTINVRIELGSQSVTKTIAGWAANTTPFDNIFIPNSAAKFRAFAHYDLAATTQATACDFNVHFSGLQAV